MMQRALIPRDFSLAYIQQVGSADTPMLYNIAAMWSALEGSILLWVLVGTRDTVAYINKDVEAIFDEAGRTYDTEFRREKYKEAQQIISEESPYVFLFYQKSWSGQNNRVQGIEPTALGIGWNFEDWYIQGEALD